MVTTSLAVFLLMVGIDVAKAKLDVVVLVNGRPLGQTFANTLAGFRALLAWLRQFEAQQIQVCLEATGSYSDAIARFLWEQGIQVSLLNPAVLVAFRSLKAVRRKTDQTDALLLAQYGEQEHPALWTPLPEPIVDLRYLLAYRLALQKMLQQCTNRLEAGRMDAWIRQQTQQQLDWLQAQIDRVEVRLLTLVHRTPLLREPFVLLQSIPGIGWILSLHLLAQIGQIQRFPHAASLVSLAGLGVSAYDSGSSVHRPGHLDRRGQGRLRSLLYWSAIVAMHTDPAIAAWAQRLQARGKAEKVVITAVMRKLLHIAFGVWKQGRPYDEALILAQAQSA